MEQADLSAVIAEAQAVQTGPKRSTRITLDVFDGSYDFQLSLKGMIAIEEKVGMGIGGAYSRLMQGRFRNGDEDFGVPSESAFGVAMVLEIIRQGLIGGNKGRSDGKEFEVGALKANSLVDRYLDPGNSATLLEAWNLAAAIIHAAVVGVEVPDEGDG